MAELLLPRVYENWPGTLYLDVTSCPEAFSWKGTDQASGLSQANQDTGAYVDSIQTSKIRSGPKLLHIIRISLQACVDGPWATQNHLLTTFDRIEDIREPVLLIYYTKSNST